MKKIRFPPVGGSGVLRFPVRVLHLLVEGGGAYMADEVLRTLQQQWVRSGVEADGVAFLHEALRQQRITERAVLAAARCGHAVARQVVQTLSRLELPQRSETLSRWVLAVAYDARVERRLLLALGEELCGVVWETDDTESLDVHGLALRALRTLGWSLGAAHGLLRGGRVLEGFVSKLAEGPTSSAPDREQRTADRLQAIHRVSTRTTLDAFASDLSRSVG